MIYFPIMGELLSSDSLIFMLLGLVIAAIIGIVLKSTRKNIAGLSICLVIYVVSELASNVRSNYFLELILLFVGTLAIGGILGFLIGFVVTKIRNKN